MCTLLVKYKAIRCIHDRNMTRKFDFLIIGSGVAGMSYALKVARAKKGKLQLFVKRLLKKQILPKRKAE